MPVRLLALDLDGTLVQRGEHLAEVDITAIKRARAAGIAVTIATGRIATGALAIAQRLGLDLPIVCADGAVLCDPCSGVCIESTPLDSAVIEGLDETLEALGAHSFWFTADEIHGELGAGEIADYVRTWSPSVTLHPKLKSSPVWAMRDRVAMALGVGARQALDDTVAWVARVHPSELSVAVFPLGHTGQWVLLARRADVDKSTGLAQVARRLGVRREDTAVVGDWINDIPMFRWAGRSFAMGQSPEEVSRHATDKLVATHHTGGGVAEAISAILDSD